MGITIKDIAKECGVSVATVSMALSDKPSRVSERTKKKVQEIAKKYNYRPNNAAVSLANKKSRLVGIVFNDLRNTHIASLFMAINGVLEKNGYSLVCHIIDSGKDIDIDLIRDVTAENIGALIWAKSIEMHDIKESEFLENIMNNLGIPIITMDEYEFDCKGVDILFDYEKGGYMATRHLIECGHKRIGCVAGKKSFYVTMKRLNGYKKALEESGIPYDSELVYFGDYTMESGYEAFSYILGQKVTAVFSMNDEMAFGIYRATRLYGISIPEDISIIGFDNVPFADVMQTPLTTIGVPVEEMGKKVGEKVVELIEKKGESEKREKIMYSPKLLVRGSTRTIL
jgi:LacI family transcriptional regulator